MNTPRFGVKRSKFKVTVGPACWKMHFSALVILKITGLNFTKLSLLMHFGTRMDAPVFGVKRSKVRVTALLSITKGPAGGGVRQVLFYS